MGETILKKSNCVNLVVSVAAEEEGRFLLVKEAKKEVKGLWNFPSGKMEFGEDVCQAAKREFLEETGYDVELTGLVGVYEYGWEDGQGVTVRFNFYGNVIDGRQKELADDVSDAKWFTKEELQELLATDKLRFGGTRRLINDLLAGKRMDLDYLYTTSGPVQAN